MIEAAIVQSIAKTFDDWTLVEKSDYDFSIQQWLGGLKPTANHEIKQDCNKRLVNKKTNVELFWRYSYRRKLVGSNRCEHVETLDRFYVLSGFIYIPFNVHCGNRIVTQYRKLEKQIAEVKRVAAEAKAKMEADERKWNLAESLLNMKRNEFGALVPIIKVEG